MFAGAIEHDGGDRYLFDADAALVTFQVDQPQPVRRDTVGVGERGCVQFQLEEGLIHPCVAGHTTGFVVTDGPAGGAVGFGVRVEPVDEAVNVDAFDGSFDVDFASVGYGAVGEGGVGGVGGVGVFEVEPVRDQFTGLVEQVGFFCAAGRNDGVDVGCGACGSAGSGGGGVVCDGFGFGKGVTTHFCPFDVDEAVGVGEGSLVWFAVVEAFDNGVNEVAFEGGGGGWAGKFKNGFVVEQPWAGGEI